MPSSSWTCTTGGLIVAETERLPLLPRQAADEAAAAWRPHPRRRPGCRAFACVSDHVIEQRLLSRQGHVDPLIAVARIARRAGARGRRDPHARREGGWTKGFQVDRHRGSRRATWSMPRHRRSIQKPMRAMGLHVNVTKPRTRLLEPMVRASAAASR